MDEISFWLYDCLPMWGYLFKILYRYTFVSTVSDGCICGLTITWQKRLRTQEKAVTHFTPGYILTSQRASSLKFSESVIFCSAISFCELYMSVFILTCSWTYSVYTYWPFLYDIENGRNNKNKKLCSSYQDLLNIKKMLF